MNEDLAVFFADWSKPVRLANGATFRAITDAPFVTVGEGPGVNSSAPSLIATDEDVEGIEFDEVLNYCGVDYVVRAIEPDGTGMTTLRLERV